MVPFPPPGVQPPAYTPSGPSPPRRALGKPAAYPRPSAVLESLCVIADTFQFGSGRPCPQARLDCSHAPPARGDGKVASPMKPRRGA